MREIDINGDVLEIIKRDFTGLYSGDLGLSSIAGGQTAADTALNSLDISGYADLRSEVLPVERRGASRLSPYIRHNLLTLKDVYRAVKSAPYADREKFRDELYWQEYARHLYARLGTRLFENLRFAANDEVKGDGWDRNLNCINQVLSELESDGWLVNQTRMWLASSWTVRNGKGWHHGQELMYRELIDGSRAANLLGWQWTVGAGTGKPYGFSRWQVEKRSPGTCAKCKFKSACPIEEFPEESALDAVPREPLLDFDPDLVNTAGPLKPEIIRTPDYVLLTIDSLGDADPALAGNPELPALFVFNEKALAKLQLSSRRIGFYLQTLQDLGTRRELSVFLGDPYEFSRNHNVAVTFAPVPSFKKYEHLAAIYPYQWLRQPAAGSLRSYSSWRKAIEKT